MPVFAGRHTASVDGDFVVFLIGMRINRPLRVRQWVPVFLAMRPMVQELEERPELGMLAAHLGLFYGGPAVVQFWRTFEHLEAYARDPERLHLPAWKRFNRTVRDNGAVGIWHETFKVRDGEYEAIYGNMPRVGLGGFGEHRPLGSTVTAARRIGTRTDDTPPVEPY